MYSASMYESAGSQFFRTTTGIQSGPHAFDESRFVMTFLAILGIMEILCNLRLVLEEKTGREIPELSRLEFLEKFSANNFALSDAEDDTSRLLNREGIADLPLLRNTFGNLKKIPRATFLGSDGSSCLISICKFDSFKNPFTMITSLS